jgi:NADH-quinone oxidoreductase subunit E
MLTEDEKTRIKQEIGKSEYPRAACVEALRLLQARHGWVSDEDVRELAPLLGMTRDELDAVATFYPFIFRRAVGRHVIFVCDSVSCWVMGYESLLNRLRERLGISMGETTHDGRFTLLPVSCIGACDRAPAMMIDRDLHLDVDPEKLESLLERYT